MTSFLSSQNLKAPTPNSHGVTIPLISLHDPYSVSGSKRPKDIADTVTSCTKVATISKEEEFIYDQVTDSYVDSGLYEMTFEIPLVPERGLVEEILSPLCTVAYGRLLEDHKISRKALLEFAGKGAGLEFSAVVHEYMPDSSVTLFLIPEDLTIGELDDWVREVFHADPYGEGPIFLENLEDNEYYSNLPETAPVGKGFESFRHVFSYKDADLYPYEGVVYWGKVIVGDKAYLVATNSMTD